MQLAMLPFLTDQIIGATSDYLSAVVRWYIWVQYFGSCLSEIIARFSTSGNFVNICVYAIPLALIIIRDCLCQQWLDRTHKVTNPINADHIGTEATLVKHSYPETRSACTYIA